MRRLSLRAEMERRPAHPSLRFLETRADRRALCRSGYEKLQKLDQLGVKLVEPPGLRDFWGWMTIPVPRLMAYLSLIDWYWDQRVDVPL